MAENHCFPSLGDAQEQRQATLYLHEDIRINATEGCPSLFRVRRAWRVTSFGLFKKASVAT